MGRWALGLEYDGNDFCGWQTQPSGLSIQDHLESALVRIGRIQLPSICAGRTDAGVHALGQVVHFDAIDERPAQAWVRGVNAHLPPSVRVLWAQPVSEAFNARRSALWRQYHYVILNRPVASAIHHHRCGWIFWPLDREAMQCAANLLIGEHDFSSFRSSLCQARSPVRHMMALQIDSRGDLIVLRFRANAFLHNMVRNLAGALVEVGRGAKPPSWIGALLAARDRRQGASTLPPGGLYLTEVRYPDGLGGFRADYASAINAELPVWGPIPAEDRQ